MIQRAGIVIILSLAIGISLSAALVMFCAAPELRIQFLPDDAFYYLTLARNFDHLHYWTFDSGTSVTSGFHPLFAYVLAGIFWIGKPTPEAFVQQSLIISYVVFLLALIIACVSLYSRSLIIPAALLGLFAVSRNVLLNSLSLMEWPLVVFFSIVYAGAIWNSRGSRWQQDLLPFGAALFGTLARTDFAVFPGCVACSSLMTMFRQPTPRCIAKPLSGLFGAMTGVGLSLLHNYFFTGKAVQSSALMKALWNEYYEINPTILFHTAQLFGLTISLFLILLGLILILGAKTFMPGRTPRRLDNAGGGQIAHQVRLWWLGNTLTVGFYLLLYMYYPAGVQPWYTANLIVPLFIMTVLPMIYCAERDFLKLALTAILPALFITQVIRLPQHFRTAQWPHQIAMYQAGNFLRRTDTRERVGSWNAGIIGFYQGGSVINLDGLVNNDIYLFAKENRLPQYIDEKQITLLAEFENMLTAEIYRKKGGYDSPDFMKRLQLVRRFTGGTQEWQSPALWRIRPAAHL